MKSTFAHYLWGIPKEHPDYIDNKWWQRRAKVGEDIKLYKANPYSPPTIVYVYGCENYNRMVDLGFTCKLVDPKPYVFDMVREQYAHKIQIWQEALKEYDAVTFLDFDCVALKPIPNDYWYRMDAGEPVKAPLYVYHLRRVNRPPNDFRKVSSASFVYIRGKEHADGIMREWEESGRPWKEEYALTSYIDKLDGGWKGVTNYAKYDTYCFNLSRIEGINKREIDILFQHYNHHGIRHILKDDIGIQERIDKLKRIL